MVQNRLFDTFDLAHSCSPCSIYFCFANVRYKHGGSWTLHQLQGIFGTTFGELIQSGPTGSIVSQPNRQTQRGRNEAIAENGRLVGNVSIADLDQGPKFFSTNITKQGFSAPGPWWIPTLMDLGWDFGCFGVMSHNNQRRAHCFFCLGGRVVAVFVSIIFGWGPSWTRFPGLVLFFLLVCVLCGIVWPKGPNNFFE